MLGENLGQFSTGGFSTLSHYNTHKHTHTLSCTRTQTHTHTLTHTAGRISCTIHREELIDYFKQAKLVINIVSKTKILWRNLMLHISFKTANAN